MSFLFIAPKLNLDPWVKACHAIDSRIKVAVWPAVSDPKAVSFVAVWRQPKGIFINFPNLKCIASLGAGVEHILEDPSRPCVPIVRVIDTHLVQDMSQYVVWAVLHHVRHMHRYLQGKTQAKWQHYIPLKYEQNIGIMGLGQLGQDAAVKLQGLGFRVLGWSRSLKTISNVHCFYGGGQLSDFLSQTDVLICLLPLTDQTRHILNQQTFSQLRKGAYVINVGRGGHLVDQDLIVAINAGQLSGACLDVFHQEPLPQNSPLWQHPRVLITPHISAVTHYGSVAQKLMANYRRVLRGEPLTEGVVDVGRGY